MCDALPFAQIKIFSVEHKVNRDLLQVTEAFKRRVENPLKAVAELQLEVLSSADWKTTPFATLSVASELILLCIIQQKLILVSLQALPNEKTLVK